MRREHGGLQLAQRIRMVPLLAKDLGSLVNFGVRREDGSAASGRKQFGLPPKLNTPTSPQVPASRPSTTAASGAWQTSSMTARRRSRAQTQRSCMGTSPPCKCETRMARVRG